MKSPFILSALILRLCVSISMAYDWSANPGTGDPNNPYQISTAEQLMAIGSNPNLLDKSFLLTNDIIFDPNNNPAHSFTSALIAPDSNPDQAWNGIPFTGRFNGNGHRIDNLTANGNYYVGLFGLLDSGAVIQDLTLRNFSIEGIAFVGGLAGRSKNAKITSCSASGSVTGTSFCGGLVGITAGTVSNCHSAGTVTGSSNLGGLAGFFLVPFGTGSTISFCSSQCEIIGTGSYNTNLGGLIGNYLAQSENNTFTGCSAAGNISAGNHALYLGGLIGYYLAQSENNTVSNCSAAGNISAGNDSSYLGGLIGYYVKSGNNIVLSACYAAGDVEGSGSSEYLGGLIGSSYSGQISFCYALGSVNGYRYLGGLVGYNQGSIRASFAAGTINGTAFQGGLVGRGLPQAVSFSYWDTETSGLAYSWGGDGKTTAQMKTPETFLHWINDAMWVLDWEKDYPHLRWENTPGRPITIPPKNYAGGSGDPDDPYQIQTLEQLAVVGFHPEDFDRHFVLTADLVQDPNEFLPEIPDFSYPILKIGNYTSPFTGSFDGGNRRIQKIKIIDTEDQYRGLFGKIGPGSEIKNLHLKDLTVQGDSFVGGLAGYNQEGIIEDCTVEASVTGNCCVGTLAGFSDQGTITNCHAEGTVSGGEGGGFLGGLVGSNKGGSITHCTAASAVLGVDGAGCIGGLAGCNRLGTISGCSAAGSVTGGFGSFSLGGLAGHCENAKVIECRSEGSVSGGDKTHSLGGLIGENCGSSVFISYSESDVWAGTDSIFLGGLIGYNFFSCTGSDFAAGDVNGDYVVGGLVGFTKYSSITACYSIGSVNGINGVGGFAGRSDEPVSFCYFPVSAGPDNGCGIPLSEPNMTQQTGFAGFDFEGKTQDGLHEFWKMPDGGGSPVLSSFYGYEPPALPGDGRAWNPFLVSTAEELAAVFYYPYDAVYTLTEDIDLAGIDWSIAVIPDFKGTFNGSGRTIRNLQMESGSWLGLFGTLRENSAVYDLHLIDFTIAGQNRLGGLAGYNERGKIYDCTAAGSIRGQQNSTCLGGLVGENIDGKIIRSQAECTMDGTGTTLWIGGLVGYNAVGEVTDCNAVINVNEGFDIYFAGGLLGYNSNGQVSRCYAGGTVRGMLCVGGLIGGDFTGVISRSSSDCIVRKTSPESYLVNGGGLTGSGYKGRITSSFATGDVAGTHYLGGLVGGVHDEIIRNCYSTAGVTGQSFLGGLVGCLDLFDGGSSEITNCYSTGSVTGISVEGGFAGFSYGTISNGYFLDTAGPDNGLGLPLSGSAMMIRSNFVDWDFVSQEINGANNFWRMCIDGLQLPILSWETGQYGDFACPDGVGMDDLEILASNWTAAANRDPNYNYACDGDGDGWIDLHEMQILSKHWQQ